MRRITAASHGSAPSVSSAPFEYPPTEVFTDSRGVLSEILRILPDRATATPDTTTTNTTPSSTALPTVTAASAETHLLLLPGNPGLIEYYRALLVGLHARFAPHDRARTTLHALGLPGHDLRFLNGARTFTIQDNINNVVDYLAHCVLRRAAPTARLVLLGHSYGAYLAARVLEALADEAGHAGAARRAAFVMLMPCIWRMGVCAGSLIRTALTDRWRIAAHAGAALTAVVPPAATTAILTALRHDPHIIDVSRRFTDGSRFSVYANMLELGKDEVGQILEAEDMAAVKRMRTQRAAVLLLVADEDHWCPPQAQEAITRAFGDVAERVRAGDGVEHAFVLSEAQTASVADRVAEWLLDNVLGADVDD